MMKPGLLERFAWLFVLLLREDGGDLHSRQLRERALSAKRDERLRAVVGDLTGLTMSAAGSACRVGADRGWLEHVDGPAGGTWRAAA